MHIPRGIRWFTFFQDLFRKKEADDQYRAAERNSPEVGQFNTLLQSDVAQLADDPEAGWALRRRLKRTSAAIQHKFTIRDEGTKWSWWFIPLALVTLYLLGGLQAVGFGLPEWAAVARNLPTDIRSLFIGGTFLRFWGITPELAMRHLEDRLLPALPSVTAYIYVLTKVGRALYQVAWFTWMVVGISGAFVTITSARRAIWNTIEGYFIKNHFLFVPRKRSDAFQNRARQLRERLVPPTNHLLDLMDKHEFVPTYWEMIWEVCKLSVNLANRNSFMRDDVGDLLDGVEKCYPGEPILAIAHRAYPGLCSWPGFLSWPGTALAWLLVWLFGWSEVKHPVMPKLIAFFATVIIMGLAVGPFALYEFVLGTAVVWGTRCCIRIFIPAISPLQPFSSVAIIFGNFVSSGLLDFEYTIALFATKFKAFDDWRLSLGLLIIQVLLVETVSDAIAPLCLVGAQKFGWVEPPTLLLRCQQAAEGGGVLIDI